MRVRGPYSIVYYQSRRRSLYFARDPIGRHSLLLKLSPNRTKLTLSSSVDRHTDGAVELPAIGIFVFDLETLTISLYPWRRSEFFLRKTLDDLQNQLSVEIVVFDAVGKEADNRRSPCGEPEVRSIAWIDDILSSIATKEKIGSSFETENSTFPKLEVVVDIMKSVSARPEVRARMQRVLKLLKRSVQLRVEKKPNYCSNCVRSMLDGDQTACGHAKVGILFSGGLDSTIIAALADEFVARDESIDLINVAFEKARRPNPNASKKNSRETIDLVNFDVPDRKTGRQALAELREIRPWRRWNFVEVWKFVIAVEYCNPFIFSSIKKFGISVQRYTGRAEAISLNENPRPRLSSVDHSRRQSGVRPLVRQSWFGDSFIHGGTVRFSVQGSLARHGSGRALRRLHKTPNNSPPWRMDRPGGRAQHGIGEDLGEKFGPGRSCCFRSQKTIAVAVSRRRFRRLRQQSRAVGKVTQSVIRLH